MIPARFNRRAVWLLAGVPTLAALAGLGASDWTSPQAVLNAAGRIAGVAGLALLLLAAALSARVPGFDQPFGGLTRLWRTHHLLGAGAFLLLLLHPLLLAVSAGAAGTGAAVDTLFPPLGNLAVWSGWAALALMATFLAPSFKFFGRPRYERWKWVHRLSGPAVLLALAHTFWLSRTMPARTDVVVWSVFAALAVGAVVYRWVFSRRIGRLRYRVGRVDRVANNVVELTLEPEHRRLHYRAGNFVYLTPYDPTLAAGHGEEHPYTISSSPDEAVLRIAIKDLGDASRAMQTVAVGSRVAIEGPYGRLFRHPDRVVEPELWVAGGIGITPFLARLRHLARRQVAADALLVYCVQDEARALYADELTALAASLPGFRLYLHYFYREGPLGRDYLLEVCPDLAERDVYVCGPLPLYQLVRQHVRDAGVAPTRLRSEEFELL